MKKFLAALACGAFIIASTVPVQADPFLFGEQPQQQQVVPKGIQPNVNYPTVMIGQFMSFCINMIMMKLSGEGVPRNVAAENAAMFVLVLWIVIVSKISKQNFSLS